MADFVDCDFNETEPANESFDIFENDEPPAKKRRGANIKYKFVEIVEFADYFDRQYIKKNKFWFAANGQGIRQNNGMEASNKWIKRDFINRRLPLMEAIAALKKWLYVCAHKNYGDPAISVKTNEWIAAHDLKRVTKVIFSGGTWYLRRSKSEWNDAI